MFATLILCVTETYCKFTKTQIKPKCVIGTGLRLAVVAVNFVGFPVSGRSDIYIYIYTHTHICIMVTSFHLQIARPHIRTVPLLTICRLPFRLEINCGPNLKSSLTPWAATCVALCRQSTLISLSNLGKPKNV